MSQSENTKPKPGGHSKLYAMIAVAGIAAAFFLATYLAGFITAKSDLTENKIYTVSDGTKEVLGDLPVEVKLRYYVSSEKDGLPPRIRDYARRFGDLLREYEGLSGGKLKVEQLDPSPDTDDEDSAIADGVSPSLDQFTQDQYYFSVVLTSLGQIVALPPVDQIPEPTLEYLLTKAINEVSTIQDSKPKLTVVSGVPLNGNAMQGQPGYYLFAELSRRFSIDYIDPAASNLVEPDDKGDFEDPDAVIVVHPHNISDEMEFELDQYVLRGGRLLAFVDPAFYFAPRGGQPPFPGAPPTPSTPQKSDLPSLFKAWGVNFSPDRIVADMVYKSPIGMPDDTPVVLTLSEDALDPDDPVISQISNAFLILAGSLDGKSPDKINREILLRSSAQSKLVVDRTDPSQLPQGVQPQPSLRILHPEANHDLVTGFQSGSSGIIPRTKGLDEPGIVGAVYSPDVPRKLVITTRDTSGKLAGNVTFIGTNAAGKQITEKVVIEAGKNVHFTKDIYATVTSVSHDFGKTAGKNDTLDIAGVGVEHPLAIRLTGKFATAFPDGRPKPAAAPPGPGGGLPFPGGGPGFSIPGAPGAVGEPGEEAEPPTGAEPKVDSPESVPAPDATAPDIDAPKEPEPATSPETADPTPPEVETPTVDPKSPGDADGTTEQPAPPTTTEPGEKGEAGEEPPPTLPEVTPPTEPGTPVIPSTPENPLEEPKKPEIPALKQAEKEGVVVIVADVDMINNQFTSTVERRLVPPGNIVDALVPNRQWGNLSFALNVVEQLTGDTRLLAIRSRSASSRPFTRIREIETEANKDMVAKEAEAQKEIENLIGELQALETEKGSDDRENLLLKQKQDEKITSVQGKLISKKKELREIQKAKKAKTEALVAKIKAWNIIAVPVFVILIGLSIAVARRFMTAAR